jgi:hypothetical protein
VSNTAIAYDIKDKILSALDMIEEAVRQDPFHVSSYDHVKECLEEADSSITFCIED